MTSSVRIENVTIISMANGQEPALGHVRVEDEVITHVGPDVPTAPNDEVLDASGGVLIPGFVQTHIHLCQTLFRNLADDLTLLDWLRLRIWPMEAALEARDMRASADLGLAELVRGGTTTILDMGSVEHTDEIGAAVEAAGIRAFIGKAMMDRGEGLPKRLKEDTKRSLRDSERLKQTWHGAAGGRIEYAYAPRFAPSCTTELLMVVGETCAEQELVIHTHCAESKDEIALIQRDFGVSNLTYLDDCGITGGRSVFAHMVHLDPIDLEITRSSGTSVTHCPSSNCKLASGVAPIPDYLAAGINVALGADGAPCNNTLDAFMEMRLAALMHKPRSGPTAMTAETVLRMATLGGAIALGRDDRIGTIEPGKRADLVHLRLDRPFNGVAGDPISKIVYTGSRENVVDVWCDGSRVVKDGALTRADEREVMARGQEAAKRVLGRL